MGYGLPPTTASGKSRRNCLRNRARLLCRHVGRLGRSGHEIADCIQTSVKESKNYDFRVFCLAQPVTAKFPFQILKREAERRGRLGKTAEGIPDQSVWRSALGGRLSGEYGIGLKRLKQRRKKYTDPPELDLMKTIKRAVDPK